MFQKLVTSLILTWTVSAAAVDQVVFADFAGQKGGAIEKLYSPEGQAALVQKMLVVKNPGDSVYFIVETADYSRAVIATAYVSADGAWAGRLDAFYREDKAASLCQPASMKTLTIDERADKCYYDQDNYGLSLGVVGPVSYSSPQDFLAQVRGWSELNTPLNSFFDMVEKNTTLKTRYDHYFDIIRTTKLTLFIGKLVMNEEGYTMNLSEPTGWAQGPVALDAEQVKVAAAIQKLTADHKMYLSKNMMCEITSGKTRGVVDRTAEAEACRGGHLMGETLEDLYNAMTEAGYQYDETSTMWKIIGI